MFCAMVVQFLRWNLLCGITNGDARNVVTLYRERRQWHRNKRAGLCENLSERFDVLRLYQLGGVS